MAGSHITVPGAIALTRNEVERTTHLRADADWLAGAWADSGTKVLVVEDGQVLVTIGGGGAELIFVSPSQAPAGERFLLGVDEAGVAYFGVGGSLAAAHGAVANTVASAPGSSAAGTATGTASATGTSAAGTAPRTGAAESARGSSATGSARGTGAAGGAPGTGAAASAPSVSSQAVAGNGRVAGPGRDPGVRRAGLRETGTLLTDHDAGLLTHAVALANWHAVAGFCPRCGAPTRPEMAGHSRRCTVDGSEHFPRSDPAVIMSVTDSGDRLLLARNAQWPPGRVSVLAGFVEPGESAEQAVAREVHEETGVVVTEVSYAGSQPWPMPHNLMLGFRARAEGAVIRVDGDEIAEARWYSRDDLRHALETGVLRMPPSLSISRWLIETWFGADLPRQTRPAS